MAGDVTVTVNFNLVPGVTPKLRAGAAAALNSAIMATIGYADPLTPVDTGLLKGNKTIKNASPGSLSASATWNQYYGIYIERGTRRGIKPHRFAEGGAERAKPLLISEMAAVGGKLV